MVLRAPIVVHALWVCVLLVLLKAASPSSQRCLAGFTGTNCTIDIDDCDNNNCSGNGNCSDRVNGYLCQCNEGFYGINCEINTGPCSPNPCGNNGSCSVKESLIQCNCTPDYEGERCETEKPRKIFTIDLTMDRVFDPRYAKLSDPVTLGLTVDLTDIFQPFFRDTFEGFVSIEFLKFSSGSLRVTFEVTFAASSRINETAILEALTKANSTSQLRFESFTTVAVNNNLRTSPPNLEDTTPTESPEVPPWVIALAVSSVIIIALVVIAIFLLAKIREEKKVTKELGVVFESTGSSWESKIMQQINTRPTHYGENHN
ncbi:uncharacterized protein [Montipora foliosa]|uniref:uncharacterized protein isoform X1 n=1 Tax=Montipora foliosa TaxID=591990 RepID=UPI0035F0FB44